MQQLYNCIRRSKIKITMPLTLETLELIAENLSLIDDNKRRDAFKPWARLLQVRDADFNKEFDKACKLIKPPRYDQFIEILSKRQQFSCMQHVNLLQA